MKTIYLFSIAIVGLGCEPTGSGSTTGGTTTTSSGSMSGSPSGYCTGTGIPPSVYEPLPSTPACASPTSTKTAMNLAGYCASPALASCGGMIGFAYSTGQANITFQALDPAGTPIGDPLPVSHPANSIVPKVRIASNRLGFMVCWSDWDTPLKLQCGAVDPEQRVVTVGPAIAGSSVSVAWGAGGYVVVYKDPDTDAIKAQHLGDDAVFVGDPVDLGATTMLYPEVAAQGANFTYAAQGVFGEFDGMTLQPTMAPNLASSAADPVILHIAATPKTSAILQWVQASVVSAGTTQTSPLTTLWSTPGLIIHSNVAAADSSFAGIWGADTVLRYRAFDEAGQLLGDSDVAVVDDGKFFGVAVVATEKGFVAAGCHQDSASVAQILCP